MKKAIISIILVLLVGIKNGDAMGGKLGYKKEVAEKYKQINILDSINKAEAIIIAQKYLIEEGLDKSYFLFRNSIEEVEFGNQWKVTFKAKYLENIKQANIFGLLGIFKWWTSVYIDKKNGEIKCVAGPDL